MSNETKTNDNWRTEHSSTLKLGVKISSRLRAYKIETVGALADLIAKDPPIPLGLYAADIEIITKAILAARTPLLIETDLGANDEPDAATEEILGILQGAAESDDKPVAREPSILDLPLDLPLEPTDSEPIEAQTAPPAAAPAPASEPPILLAFRRAKRLADYDLETAGMIEAQEAEVGRAAARWKGAAASASTAKKAFDAAAKYLTQLVQDRADERGKPSLLDWPLDDDADADPSAKAEAEGVTMETAWKDYPLNFERWKRFGLTEKDCEKLNGGETKKDGVHPLMVFGDVSRFITPHGPGGYARTLKDIKGFGEKGLERFEAAEAEFWKWWNANGAGEFGAERTPAAAAEVVDVDAQLDAEAAASPPPAKSNGRARKAKGAQK